MPRMHAARGARSCTGRVEPRRQTGPCTRLGHAGTVPARSGIRGSEAGFQPGTRYVQPGDDPGTTRYGKMPNCV